MDGFENHVLLDSAFTHTQKAYPEKDNTESTVLSKLLIENSGISEICPPRSGGWRLIRSRGRFFSYLAAYVLGLVLGLVCHIADSSVAGNQLRSSRMLEFLAVLVLLVLCANLVFFSPFRIF